MESEYQDEGGVTRRDALMRGAGAFWTFSTLTAVVAPTTAWGAAGPDQTRLATFAALLETYDGVDVNRLVVSRGRALPAELQSRIAASGSPYRIAVTDLLDQIATASGPKGLAGLSVAERRKTLRGWATASEPSDALMLKRWPSDERASKA